MKKSIFRKSVLDKLSSPEQLDKLMKVTGAKSWIVLFAVFAVVVVAVIWGIWGEISVNVNGQGILMKSGGIIKVQHIASGEIKDIKVKPGDIVTKGEVIARVTQYDLIKIIREERIKLKELEEGQTKTEKFSRKDAALQKKYLKQQKINIIVTINSDTEQLKFIEEKVKAYEELYAEGGIAKQTVVDMKNQYNNLSQRIAGNKNKLKQIERQLSQVVITEESKMTDLDQLIEAKRRDIERMEQNLSFNSNIVCPITGRVIEIMVNNGALITPGMTIISLEPTGHWVKDIQAVVFVTSEGRNLTPGMKALISPATVKKEEYGFIQGRITYVAEYPSSFQGMMRTLGNESLVRALMQLGPVLEVKVDLVPSSKTVSGFKWTSRDGPPFNVQSGTICFGTFIERKQRPISMVIPKIRQITGIY